MTATAHPASGTAATSGWLPAVAARTLDFVWPMYLTLVLALGAWVLVPTVVLGWTPVVIVSGSMAPTVQPGHVVVVEPYADHDLGPGTVVTYRDPTQDRLVTHRISAVEADGTIWTRGDSNQVDDPVPLTRDRIVGLGRLVVPAAGLPALWMHEGRMDLLAIVAALTVVTGASAATAAASGARALRARLSLRGGGGRVRRRTIGLTSGAFAVVAALAASALSGAAFMGTGDNAANTFEALTVAAPTGLTSSGTCPALDQGANGSKPGVELTWDPVADATAYEVERGTAETGPFTALGTVPESCYRDTDVNASTTYHYRVRALMGSWVGAWSDTTSAQLRRGPR